VGREVPVGIAFLALALASACGRTDRLVVAHGRLLASQAPFDPRHDRAAINILANVYEPLVERGSDLTLRPRLAESWHSPDERTWVFKLRRGVRRHDGRVLTAGDVAASFERARHDPWAAGALAPVSSVAARGEDEVVFSTLAAAEALPGRLAHILTAGQPEPGGATGPYRFRSWTPGGDVVLEAFPEYRDGPPAIATVEFRIVRDAREQARRLIQGEVQIAEDIGPEEMLGLRAAKGVKTVAVSGFMTAFLGMDTARRQTPYIDLPVNPFRDVRVREAISHAVDRKALVAGPLRGYAEPTEQLAQPGQMGFDSELGAPDLELSQARQLLGSAGYPEGFEVQLDYSSGTLDEVARELAAQLSGVGIRLRLRPSEPSEFYPRIKRRDTSLYLLRWIQPSQEINETYSWLLHTPGEGIGAMNCGGYSNERLDRLLERAAQATVPELRMQTLLAATALVRSERPILPLYRANDLYAFSDRLDFQPEPNQWWHTPLWRMRWNN
jgi:peptide/nickel transport system substrate-binding protein